MGLSFKKGWGPETSQPSRVLLYLMFPVQAMTHRHLRGAGRSLQRSQAKQPLCGGQLLTGEVHVVARVVQLAPMERLCSTSRPGSTSTVR